MNKPYYEDELVTLYLGKAEDVLPGFADESIDCVVTDPPYGIKYHSNAYKIKNPHDEIENDDLGELLLPLDELWRVTKNDGCIFSFYSHKKPYIEPRIKNNIVWVKNHWSAGDLDGDFGNQYEMIAYIPKPGFDLTHERRTGNVWYCDRVKPELHPTQKPIDITAKCIRYGSKREGDIVLDPFAGSGTTLVAAKRMGRKTIGIEMKEKYCEIIVRRLRQYELF